MGNCLMGVEFQFWQMKRVLKIGFPTVWLYLTLLSCPLKDGCVVCTLLPLIIFFCVWIPLDKWIWHKGIK